MNFSSDNLNSNFSVAGAKHNYRNVKAEENKQLVQLLSPFSLILRVIVPLSRHSIELLQQARAATSA